jgi:hypothetical protein
MTTQTIILIVGLAIILLIAGYKAVVGATSKARLCWCLIFLAAVLALLKVWLMPYVTITVTHSFCYICYWMS